MALLVFLWDLHLIEEMEMYRIRVSIPVAIADPLGDLDPV